MIIDAMDILYADKIDGFVLVSSDSDFTKLATRLRESGKIVYGFGEMKTPNALSPHATASSTWRSSINMGKKISRWKRKSGKQDVLQVRYVTIQTKRIQGVS